MKENMSSNNLGGKKRKIGRGRWVEEHLCFIVKYLVDLEID